MANYSQYKKLELPTSIEHYNINVVNKNNQVIDSELHKLDLKNESQDNLLLATKEALKQETERATRKETDLQNVINSNKPIWDDKYTKNEIDNKFSALETNIDWKESVATYEDIATTYPNPDDGWTVNVKDTDYTYRYNGSEWVVISANAIPKATNGIDGILSKEDHTKYEDANSKKHTHDNKSIIDKITQTLLDNWSTAYTHISDTIKHITSTERTQWGNAYTHSTSTHAPSNAERNIIVGVQKNGTDLSVSSDRKVNITVPTKLSELENDSDFTKGTGVRGNYYGTCSTAATTKDKVVTVSSDQNFELKVGCIVGVKFTNSNTYSATADNPITLNVNNTGAKNIYYNNTSNYTGTSTIAFGYANRYNYYMYDGTYWVWMSQSIDSNTTYSAMSTDELTTGTATTSRVVRADYLKSGIETIAKASYSQAPDTNGSNTLGLMSGDDRYRLLHELLALTGGTISGNLTVNGNLAGSVALTTPEQVAANTAAGKFVSAVAVKNMANNMGVSVKDGKLVWTNAWGADTEIPFSSSGFPNSLTTVRGYTVPSSTTSTTSTVTQELEANKLYIVSVYSQYSPTTSLSGNYIDVIGNVKINDYQNIIIKTTGKTTVTCTTTCKNNTASRLYGIGIYVFD